MDNTLTFIGLMKRAKALEIGVDRAFDAVRAGKIRLLCMAGDAAKNTIDGARAALSQRRAVLVTMPYTKAELGAALGQGECAVFGVTTTGFALSLCQKLGFEEPAAQLAEKLERDKRRKQKKPARPEH